MLHAILEMDEEVMSETISKILIVVVVVVVEHTVFLVFIMYFKVLSIFVKLLDIAQG